MPRRRRSAVPGTSPRLLVVLPVALPFMTLPGVGQPAGADDAGCLQSLHNAARTDAVLVPPAGTIWLRDSGGALWQPAGDGTRSVLWDIAATEGGTAPHCPDAGIVRDRSATWRYGEPFAISVGAGIWFNNGESDKTACSAGLATNGRFKDAVIDLSRATVTSAGGAGTGRCPAEAGFQRG